jgi:uncharacterized protein
MADSLDMIEMRVQAEGVSFAVRVVPRASRDAIEGEYQGALKVRLTAPPVEGRANEALRCLLAGRLNVPVSAVRIVAGEKSRTKRVFIEGASRDKITELMRTSQKARDSSHARH